MTIKRHGCLDSCLANGSKFFAAVLAGGILLFPPLLFSNRALAQSIKRAPSATTQDKASPGATGASDLVLPPEVMEPEPLPLSEALDEIEKNKTSAQAKVSNAETPTPELKDDQKPESPSSSVTDSSPPASTAAPEPGSQPDARPMVKDESPKDDTSILNGPQEIDTALESPTRSVEEYEQARKARLHAVSIPHYSVNLTIAPKAFNKADLRAPTLGGFDKEKPTLHGVLLGYDRMLFHQAGMGMLGVDGGLYASTNTDPFSGLAYGIQSIAPHVQYQFAYFPRQWFVPTVKFDYEFVHYNYSFQNKTVKGWKNFPRIDLGMLFFLNVLEPSSAAQMHSNYGIKRTYLAGYFTIANDTNKTDFDLSEKTFRVGLRFEM